MENIGDYYEKKLGIKLNKNIKNYMELIHTAQKENDDFWCIEYFDRLECVLKRYCLEGLLSRREADKILSLYYTEDENGGD